MEEHQASEVAVSLSNVSKVFKLPHEKSSSIKSSFINVLRRRRNYELQQALDNISFDIKRGEFFGIVGRNGSGKSTLLKIIAGIYRPSEGRVGVKGKLVPFIELGVGFNPELTGRENVYLNGALLGFSEKEVSSMYKSVVAFAELSGFMDQKLKNYSSGMQVRLAFSMAIRAEADVLLIDEVLAVGDADFQRKCFNYFDQLRNKKTTVIFVSHDMDAVREYCDRVLLIEQSQVKMIGETSEVAQEYLKLFADSQVKAGSTDSEDRWGDRHIYIDDISIKLSQGSIVVIEKIKAKRDVPGPVVGFRIKDATGRDITGTNTKVEGIKLDDMAKGDTVEVSFEMPNILRDGEYSLDPAVLHADGITVGDWWNQAQYFNIAKGRHLPYSIDPGFKTAVKKV